MSITVDTFQSEVINRMSEFLRSIGIEVKSRQLTEPTFIEGILIDGSTMYIDEEKLEYPGDILHEAGHIAVVAPSVRSGLNNKVGDDPGDEIAAIAWSWAALKHLDLEPQLVFHPGGYKGSSGAIIESFQSDAFYGQPLLQWYGMTAISGQAEESGIPPFPHMIKWIRDCEEGG